MYPRSFGSWCIKGTEETTLEVDSSVPLMYHDHENVANTNWSSLLDDDPNMAYNNFIDEYSRICNACFPAIKGKLLNNRSSSWISPGLLKSINKKN